MSMQRIKFEGKTLGDTYVAQYIGNKKYLCRCICGEEFICSSDALRNGYKQTCNHFDTSWKQDMIGKTYDEWTVMEYAGNSKFMCQCSCGEQKIVSKYDLEHGKSKSCGHDRLTDLTGQHINEWDVLKYLGNKKYLCRCSCGTIRAVVSADLRSGRSKSCGHSKPKIDLTGQRFGDWKVIEYAGSGKWSCRDPSGYTSRVGGFQLLNGLSKSRGNVLIDLTGKQIGELTVLEYLGNGVWDCQCSCGRRVVRIGKSLRSNPNSSCGHLIKRQVALAKNPNRSKEQLVAVESRENLLNFIGSRQYTMLELSVLLGISYQHTVKVCNKFGISGIIKLWNPTYMQDDVTSFVRTLTDCEIITNTRKVIKPKELDIYIPSKRLAIEFNGNLWHSSVHKSKEYHQAKTIACGKQGIRLIHIFEYEWSNIEQQSKIKSFLSDTLAPKTAKEVIWARKTEAKLIDLGMAQQFEELYHLQGSTNSSINIELFYNNELIGVMTFGPPRFTHEYEYELIRMCFKFGINVAGGLEKMFKYFINKYNPKSIFTYADLTKFTGNSYLRLGFNVVANNPITNPNYVWVSADGKNVIPRYQTTKQKLVKQGYGDLGDTEVEIMENLGYVQVFDSGSIRLEYKQQNS